MFNIKQMMSLGLMLLMLSTMLVFTTGVASARTTLATASCTYSSCDYKSPVSTGCQNTAIVEHYESGTIDNGIGITIQLQFSTACHAAWGRVVFSRTLPSGYYGYAVLDYTDFSAETTCNDSGGDGDVLPGQSILLYLHAQ